MVSNPQHVSLMHCLHTSLLSLKTQILPFRSNFLYDLHRCTLLLIKVHLLPMYHREKTAFLIFFYLAV
jgi:hypothetical protein